MALLPQLSVVAAAEVLGALHEAKRRVLQRVSGQGETRPLHLMDWLPKFLRKKKAAPANVPTQFTSSTLAGWLISPAIDRMHPIAQHYTVKAPDKRVAFVMLDSIVAELSEKDKFLKNHAAAQRAVIRVAARMLEIPIPPEARVAARVG